MGWLDSITGGGDPDPNDGPDAYRVVRKTDKGGWKPVDDFDQMDEPIDKDTFEYNASPLKPGEYRLFAVKDNLQTQPPEGEGWILEIEGGDDRDDSQDDEIAELKREIRAMRSESSEQQQQREEMDPEEAVEKQMASFQLAALNNDEFMKRHGEKLVLQMFDADTGGGRDGSGIEYDDWQKNPVGASLFETFKMVRDEPEQIERLGEAIGRGAGSFMGAAADGFADDGQTLSEARDEAPAEPDDTDEQQPTREIDAGPASMDDLGAGDGPNVDTDTLRDNIAEARTARRAGPGEQDAPDGEPAAPATDGRTGAESDRGATDDEHPTDALNDTEARDTGEQQPDDTTETMTDDTTETDAPDASDTDNAAAEIAGDL